MALPKIGTVLLRKDVRTRQYTIFLVFLGSRNGNCYYLNRQGAVMHMTTSFFEHVVKSECKIVGS